MALEPTNRRDPNKLVLATDGHFDAYDKASGQPIPDERLEADPLAELTLEEAAAAERGTLEEGHDAVGLVSAGHPFEVLADADITPEEEPASEEDDDEPVPEPSLGIHIERNHRTR